MRDIALFLDSFFFIPSLAQSSLLDRRLYVQNTNTHHSQFTTLSDANTIGSISGVGESSIMFWAFLTAFMTLNLMLPASIDWSCAVQIAAGINIGNRKFVATQAQTLCVHNSMSLLLSRLANIYAVGSI